MTYSTLLYQVSDDGILTLTLNRPDKLNSFTTDMAEELVNAFERASEDDSVKVVVVTGAGRAFCAGMDLTREGNVFGLNEDLRPTLEDMDQRRDAPEIFRGVRDTGGRVTLAIFACKKPVIGAINGPAVGIGATMMCAMDVRLASDKARIGFVFGKIGIVPEAASTWFLPRIVGISQALEWTYSGDIFDAAEAKAAGLVKEVYPAEQLLEKAYELARKFSKNRSPVGIAMTRHMMYLNSAQPHPEDAHRVDSLAIFYASLADGKEGVRSFMEKRDPNFTTKASQMPAFYEAWIKGSSKHG